MGKPDFDDATSAAMDEWRPDQMVRLLRLAVDEPADPDMLMTAALDESSTLEDLREVKTEAKRLLDSLPAGGARDAVRLAYHLAVAQAEVRFGARISRISPVKRRSLYREFAAALAGHPIGAVFERAAGGEF